MFNFLLAKWIITVCGLYVIRFLFFRESFRITGFAPIMTVALVIAPLNAGVKEIAEVLGMPTSMGLLIALCVVLNTLVIYLASYLVPGFFIENLMTAATVALFFGGYAAALAYFAKDLMPALAPFVSQE